MRIKRLGIALAFALLLSALGRAAAHEILQGDECTLASDQIITGDLFVLCRSLKIDGTIQGNLIGAAYTAEINGAVKDGIYLIAGQLDVRGTLGENLIFGGPVLNVHTTSTFDHPQADLISLSLSTLVRDGVDIPGSITSLSYQLLVQGRANRVSFWGSALQVSGTVDAGVDATVGDPTTGDASQLQGFLALFPFDVRLVNPGLVITERGAVGGLLRYTGAAEGQIEGQLAQTPEFTPVVTRPDFTQIELNQEENAAWFSRYFSNVVREFLALLLIGLVGIALFPRLMAAPLHNLRWRPLSSVGIGLLTFLMSFVVLFVLLLILLVLIAAALLLRLGDIALVGGMALGVANVGGASIFYFVAIYVSRILVCLALGRLILWATVGYTGTPPAAYFSLGIGAALLSLLVWLPFVGWVLNALALGLGLGAICLTVASLELRPRESAPPSFVPSPDLPPPIIDDTASTPGMSNLPQGFKWWTDD